MTEEHKHKVFELTKQFMDALSEFGCDSSIKIDSTLKLIEIYPNPNGPRIYNVTLKFDVVDD